MPFHPDIAAIRFGTGRSPRHQPPEDAQAILARLSGPDHAATAFPMDGFDAHLERSRENAKALKSLRHASRAGDTDADAAIRAIIRQRVTLEDASFRGTLLRGITTEDGFRERLTAFWADHFSTRSRNGPLRGGVGAFVESAIRPNVAGRFSDLLIAASTHPIMLHYLDQTTSIGPNSAFARSNPDSGAGLNENLAREILELHTLGVDGPYSQTDVRELAKLLTGVTFTLKDGPLFRPPRAEPGPETVLGKLYGGEAARFRDVVAVLTDLAHHPATAAHLARKIAVHFVSDTPDPALVDALTAAYLDSAGDLLVVYDALLSHPAAWDPEKRNVKPPLLYITSALRALGTPAETIAALSARRGRQFLTTPLRNMGHHWEFPSGPDGLPESDVDWISPANLSARVQWALAVPERLATLPDPRRFLNDALGETAPEPVRFAARAAETRAEGIGLVLMSPAFQRM